MLRRLFPTTNRHDRVALAAILGLSVIVELAALSVPVDMIRLLPERESVSLEGKFRAPDTGPSGLVVQRDQATALADIFIGAGSDLPAIRAGLDAMPPVLTARLPTDLAAIQVVQHRKDLFFQIVLPLILKENARIASERARLQDLAKSAGETLSIDDRVWLTRLTWHYRLLREGQEASSDAATFEALRLRIDGIPVALAMAQAAEESGWGTSRFAIKGNALYGQWAWRQTDGLTPAARDAGKSHVVRAFPDLATSVAAYMRNLNTNRAYKAFRQARAGERAHSTPGAGARLADHLTAYSERGPAYADSLRTIMRVNRLAEFAGAELGDLRLLIKQPDA
jgi:Bax protein